MKRRLAYSTVYGNETQTERADKRQVKNNAGGYVFEIDDMSFVKRFLILGTEGGTYYANQKEHTRKASDRLLSIVDSKGIEVVDTIVDISNRGLAIKNDSALFLLALCASSKDSAVRSYAMANLEGVARIPTHLYHFLEFSKQLRGWGRAFKRGIQNWFLNKTGSQLAFSLTKYAQRDGYSARDVLRLAKPVTKNEDQNLVFKYVAKGFDSLESTNSETFEYLEAIEKIKTIDKSKDIVKLIEKFKLPMEVIPTDKRSKEVYQSVLKTAGMTWILRNLANLSRHGIISQGSWDNLALVESKLTDEKALKNARIHPISILTALSTYRKGHSRDNSWEVNATIILNALNNAFYKSFEYVEPLNKRFYVGLDCSGSMWSNYGSSAILTPAEIGACFAMTMLRTEKKTILKGFNNVMQPINVHSNSSLEQTLDITRRVNWGSTDCALPMMDALLNKIEVDAFVVITDNETYFGKTHPYKALQEYRRVMGIDAKLIVLSVTATNFSIADPSDKGMLDIAGFSPDVFTAINSFLKL